MRKLALLIIAALPCLASGQKQYDTKKYFDDPMTSAVFNVYGKLLKENPNDWETYLRRANDFYKYNYYDEALDDVNQALAHIPAGNAADRVAAYNLRANIYQNLADHAHALEDLNSSLVLDPEQYIAIYQRANTEYELGQYAEAKQDYRKLQRMNPRSVESLVGQARIAVKEQNLGLANEYLDQAVSFDPNNAESYMRRASVRQTMGNPRGAAQDLLVAYSIDATNGTPLFNLLELSDTDYAAVIAALTDAIQQAPRVALYPYVRATVELRHNNFVSALHDYQLIQRNFPADADVVLVPMAQCQYSLGHYDDALANITSALAAKKNAAEASDHILRSQILLNLGRSAEALYAARDAAMQKDGSLGSAYQIALCQVAMGDYGKAIQTLQDADDSNSDEDKVLLGWIETNYRGSDDKSWLETMREMADPENYPEDKAYADYLMACYYAQSGDTAKALDYAEAAMKGGYANYADWTDSIGPFTVAPIRQTTQFTALLRRYAPIFGR